MEIDSDVTYILDDQDTLQMSDTNVVHHGALYDIMTGIVIYCNN